MKSMLAGTAATVAIMASLVFVAGCGNKQGNDAHQDAGHDAVKHEHTADGKHLDGTSHDDADGHGQDGSGAGHGHEDDSPLPSSLSGVWAEVQSKRTELKGLLAQQQLAQVHGVAFRIRDLVAAMPALSGDHLGDKASQLNDAVTRTADIAGLLDQYGDAGDGPATEAQVKRLDAVLDFIGGLYPAGVLGQ